MKLERKKSQALPLPHFSVLGALVLSFGCVPTGATFSAKKAQSSTLSSTTTQPVTTSASSAVVPATTLYVNPNGSGSLCSADQPCTLQAAQNKVRQINPKMQSDIVVSLEDGTYELTEPLNFTAADSGANGYYVNYQAAPGARPVISGGTRIQGWTLSDPSKNIYQAKVPAGFNTRQFYVNGVRADRTKLVMQNGRGLPQGTTTFSQGYHISPIGISQWRNPENIEVVTRNMWRHLRCPLQSAQAGGQRHFIAQSTGAQFSGAAPAGLDDVGQGAITYVGDFNGDGKSDLLFQWFDGSGNFHNTVAPSLGSTFGGPSDWLANVGQGAQTYIGDFNGDGKADLLFGWMDGSNNWHMTVSLSQGGSFSSPVDWLLNQGQGTQIFIGDYNGDGKSDVAMGWYDASGNWHWTVALSNGSSFLPGSDWLINQGQGSQVFVGDFNGDGKSDLLFSWTDDAGNFHNSVAISTGSSFAGAQDWLMNQGQGAQIYVGDFNGDRKTDLMFTWFDGGGNWHNSVALSTGSSFNGSSFWLDNEGQGVQYLLGDFTGDKKTDLLFSYNDELLTVQQPCWDHANNGPAMSDGLNWIENAYELLSQPGQWYLDQRQGLIYYIPRTGEDMNSAVAVAPRLEQLVSGQDVSSVRFTGITFAYSTWLEPSTAAGYAELQAGVHFNAANASVKIPGAVGFHHSKFVSLSSNQYLHMGSTAVSFDQGSQMIVIDASTFSDLSAGAIMFGDFDDQDQTDYTKENIGVTISNNYISKSTLEYESAAAIYLGYVSFARIDQNEIDGANYTGISVGWGWVTKSTYASTNEIYRNWIHGVMQTLTDGGAIYTLGAQPYSAATGNLIENVGPVQSCSMDYSTYQGYVALYHDNGTVGYTDTSNVIRNYCGYWTLLQWNYPDPANNSYNNVYNQNFVQSDRTWCGGRLGDSSSCGFGGNSILNLGVFGQTPPPAAAQNVIAMAGIPQAYQSVKSVRTGGLY
jgi:hypothetical protein